jgi:transposase-like protein
MIFSKTSKTSRLTHCPNCGSENITRFKIDSKRGSFLKHSRDTQIECSDCLSKFKPLKQEKESTFFGPVPFITKNCPKCHNENLYKSSKKGVGDRSLSFLGFSPYRCSSCYERFFLLKANAIKRVSQLAALVIVLFIGAYFTYSFKKGKDDHVALETKTNSSLSEVTNVEAEKQVKTVAALEKELQEESPVIITVNNIKEKVPDHNLKQTQVTEKQLPVNPEAPEQVVVPEESLETTIVTEKQIPRAPEVPEQAVAPEKSFEHIEKEVLAFIDGWKVAWQNSAGKLGDMETYLNNYSEDFTSNGIPKEKWQLKKRRNNKRKQWISIQLSDLQVEKLDDNFKEVKVSFKQEYKSSNYSDESRKVFILRQEENRWLISEENTVD